MVFLGLTVEHWYTNKKRKEIYMERTESYSQIDKFILFVEKEWAYGITVILWSVPELILALKNVGKIKHKWRDHPGKEHEKITLTINVLDERLMLWSYYKRCGKEVFWILWQSGCCFCCGLETELWLDRRSLGRSFHMHLLPFMIVVPCPNFRSTTRIIIHSFMRKCAVNILSDVTFP